MSISTVVKWGLVAGVVGVGAHQLGFFETPKCDIDGDGRVFKLVDEHTLSRFGQIGRGADLSADGTIVKLGDEVCEVTEGLVDHVGNPAEGYHLRK